MHIGERQMILRQIMWDYSISPVDIEAVLKGEQDMAGHCNKQAIFVRMLESYSWFTILQLFSPIEIRAMLSDEVIKKLRFNTLRSQYEFIQKRLQKLVSLAG